MFSVVYIVSHIFLLFIESLLSLILLLSEVSTVSDLDLQVLWPYLLEFLIPVQYTAAIGTLCKNIAAIGSRKRRANDPDYLIDYEDEGTFIIYHR
mgnify:CR=1 FL=1